MLEGWYLPAIFHDLYDACTYSMCTINININPIQRLYNVFLLKCIKELAAKVIHSWLQVKDSASGTTLVEANGTKTLYIRKDDKLAPACQLLPLAIEDPTASFSSNLEEFLVGALKYACLSTLTSGLTSNVPQSAKSKLFQADWRDSLRICRESLAFDRLHGNLSLSSNIF